jgi:hypothetical protein
MYLNTSGRSCVRVLMRLLNLFNLPNTSSRTMALGSTQPLTKMSTRNLPGGGGGKGGRRIRLTTSPPSVSRLCRENVGASTTHKPMGLHGLLQGYLYLLSKYKTRVIKQSRKLNCRGSSWIYCKHFHSHSNDFHL